MPHKGSSNIQHFKGVVKRDHDFLDFLDFLDGLIFWGASCLDRDFLDFLDGLIFLGRGKLSGPRFS